MEEQNCMDNIEGEAHLCQSPPEFDVSPGRGEEGKGEGWRGEFNYDIV
jgi:hypothetical protein